MAKGSVPVSFIPKISPVSVPSISRQHPPSAHQEHYLQSQIKQDHPDPRNGYFTDKAPLHYDSQPPLQSFHQTLRLTEQHIPSPIRTPSPPPVKLDPSNSSKGFSFLKRPTQGDWALIREMAPNQPEIAQQVALNPLNPTSSDFDSNYDEENSVEDQTDNITLAARMHNRVRSGTQVPRLNSTRTGRIGTVKKDRKVLNCHCGKSFPIAGELRRHQRHHAQEDAFICDFPDCGKVFHRKYRLYRHQELHNEPMPRAPSNSIPLNSASTFGGNGFGQNPDNHDKKSTLANHSKISSTSKKCWPSYTISEDQTGCDLKRQQSRFIALKTNASSQKVDFKPLTSTSQPTHPEKSFLSRLIL